MCVGKICLPYTTEPRERSRRSCRKFPGIDWYKSLRSRMNACGIGVWGSVLGKRHCEDMRPSCSRTSPWPRVKSLGFRFFTGT